MNSPKKLIYLLSFFISVNFSIPVFGSFFQLEHGFSSAEITRLFAAYSLSVFLFEIPTGLISDLLGEKRSLIMGSILSIVSTIFFIKGNVVLLYVGEILFGLGNTFFSGPFDSIIYKYCKTSDSKLDYDNIVSNAYTLQWSALSFSFLGCFYLTKYGSIRLAFLATLIANIFLLIITIFLPKLNINAEHKNVFFIMKSFFSEIHSNRFLLILCFLNILFLMILVSGYQILQTYLLDSPLDKTYNGLLYFLGAIFASLGSFFYNKLKHMLKLGKMFFLLCLLFISICFLGLANASTVLLIFIFVCVYRLIWGITSLMFSSMLNKNIEIDSHRNTAFSLISLGYNLCSSLLLFIFSLNNFSIKYEYIVLTILSIALLLICAFFQKISIIH
ncbi:major facilitator superfamily protein [Clostridium puniceum]|uniref:Major facilitator superfamily protein n=1 Tax=Clostridium puniceum TaxID=29367 RepID=A0A1S8TWE9_9CLOT|nr:MFS transporter [Clostridium puniceum]OOM82030.1 major facilitator superfamily protein [Clostridium puniceum]